MSRVVSFEVSEDQHKEIHRVALRCGLSNPESFARHVTLRRAGLSDDSGTTAEEVRERLTSGYYEEQ